MSAIIDARTDIPSAELDIAKSAGFGAPVTAAALQQFLAAAGSGLGHEDDAAVAKVYARNAGLTLPTKDT